MNESGLAVLAVGCLLFWPSGVKKSFGGFCGSMFVRDIKHSSSILL
jgi:fucose permease